MSKRKKKQDEEEAAMAMPWSEEDESSGEASFESPPFDDNETVQDADDDGFADPEEAEEEEFDFQASAMGQSVLSCKAAIEERLAQASTSGEARASSASGNGDGSQIVGVGISSGGSEEPASLPGQPSLMVFVENDGDQEHVRRELSDVMGVQAASDDGLPMEVVVTGVVEAYSSNRSKFRPAPAGASVGHHKITAGTIGGWARGKGNRSNRLLMVSNNHVLAASNSGKYGDSILQPGRADGGINTRDRVAILERYVPIKFSSGSVNYVDCATGWCWPSRVRRDHVYHFGPFPKYFKVGRCVRQPRNNMIVGKTGRTTNLTIGRVTSTGVSINVNFGPAGVAHFRDQFAVRSFGLKPFSAGGDSGSFVWSWDSRRCVTGLLFAGGGGTTFCNRFSRVVSALDIRLL